MAVMGGKGEEFGYFSLTMADKKKQHFLPKFYLRDFSNYNNKKTISLLHKPNNFFTDKGVIKDEASRNFYYGKDGQMEDVLSVAENFLAPIIRGVASSSNLNNIDLPTFDSMLLFIALTFVRNPRVVEKFSTGQKKLSEYLSSQNVTPEMKKTLSNHPPDMFYLNTGFSHIPTTMQICSDLSFGLIKNETKVPFITSDYPLVFYNQFAELKNTFLSSDGFGSRGLQMFLPISPNAMITLYDGEVYKFGTKKSQKHLSFSLTEKASVNELNILQVLNCDSKLYCNHQVSSIYLLDLLQKCKNIKKPHEPFITNLGNLVLQGSTQLRTKFNPCFFYINSKFKRYIIKSNQDMIRPWAKAIRQLQ